MKKHVLYGGPLDGQTVDVALPAREGVFVIAESLDEYRLELSDELNRLGLYLSSGLQQMTAAETFKLKEQFDRPMKLGPKPPTAKQLSHCFAFIGLLYVEALGKAAQQRKRDVQTSQVNEPR